MCETVKSSVTGQVLCKGQVLSEEAITLTSKRSFAKGAAAQGNKNALGRFVGGGVKCSPRTSEPSFAKDAAGQGNRKKN